MPRVKVRNQGQDAIVSYTIAFIGTWPTHEKQVVVNDALNPKVFRVLAMSKGMVGQALPAANKTVCTPIRLEFS